MKKHVVLFLVFLSSIIIITSGIKITELVIIDGEDNDNPEKVIENLYEGIDYAKEKGEYDCCIEPACTMCYLGHWKFEEGTCYCDKAMREGIEENVCPECKKGLEEGRCKSLDKNICELN